MSTDASGGVTAYKLPRHLSPEQVRAASFERAPFGRRGFEEQEVQAYLTRVAEELATRDVEIARLDGENRQLKHALREWHRQLVGYDSAEIIARTQQHIEAQIDQAEQFSREREEEAAQRYDEILAEARQRARDEAERLVHDAPESQPGVRAAQEWLSRQQTYVGALKQALGALAAQVNATQQAFGLEVNHLSDISGAATAPALAPGSPEPAPVPLSPSPPPPPLPPPDDDNHDDNHDGDHGDHDHGDHDHDDDPPALVDPVDEPPLEPLPGDDPTEAVSD